MASKRVPVIKFSNGYTMPGFGLGTFLSDPGEVERAVKYAIDIGYRHIDTAYYYDNEREIGKAIREKINDGTIKRDDLFITTKLWNNTHAEDKVVPMCKKSLQNLGLDYLDLYLIHWPFGFKEGDDMMPMDANKKLIYSDIDYLETWKGMEECVQQGLTRSIGISNFNSEQIARLLDTSTIKPVNNQLEVSVNLNQSKLIDFCKRHGITVTGYSPLGRPGNHRGIGNSLDNLKILDIAKKYQKTAAQVACRFVLQLGASPIPKSVTESRIKENFEIFDFELTAQEMDVIKSIGTGDRVSGFKDVTDHKYYPFKAEF